MLAAKCIGRYPGQQPGVISTVFPLPKCQMNFCLHVTPATTEVLSSLTHGCCHSLYVVLPPGTTPGDQWRVSHHHLTEAHIAHVIHAGQLTAVPYSIPHNVNNAALCSSEL